LASLQVAQRRPADAVDTLAKLVTLEENPAGRAALSVERGGLFWHQLNDVAAATASFERALLDDSRQLAAVRELVELYQSGPAERFVAMVERLRSLAGLEAVGPLKEKLALAYESLGRIKDAYILLGQLGATADRTRRRVELAEQLGLGGEALALREGIASSRAELEAILDGYLRAELVPFAVRLGSRLLDEAPLPSATLRLLAERLAPTVQGAKLATLAWKRLLEVEVVDPDGWTLLAEAYRKLGDDASASLADGFGAALTSTKGPAPTVAIRPLEVVVPSHAAAPADCLELGEDSMPRLNAALVETLRALGVDALQPVLDPAGGVEAYVAGGKLVLGAGALSVFGQGELPFAVALALGLGSAGEALRRPAEPIEGFENAVRLAFDAYPASLAAARVIAYAEVSVRGQDPLSVDTGGVLRTSGAFFALARRALERLE
jgi:tetratricopeptide (TPR) repeat protein